MAKLINLRVLGAAILENAASAAKEPVRKQEFDAGLAAKAASAHTHDDRYFTEAEVTAALAGKSDTGHTHDDRYYTEAEADALLLAKAAASHTHDDRYYTETEADAALAGKSDTAHTHDDRYFTEAEIDARFIAELDAYDFDARIDAARTDTSTVIWESGAGELSAIVPLGDADVSGGGKLAVLSDKVYAVLGTTAFTAAAGNHSHAAADGSNAGLMSSAHYTKLNGISAAAVDAEGALGAAIDGVEDSDNIYWSTGGGTLKALVAYEADYEADQARLWSGGNGLYLPIDSTNSVALDCPGGTPALTAAVRRKSTATATHALIAEDATGLYVEMGTVSGKPKPGDWTPPNATDSTAGLMTGLQYQQLARHEGPPLILQAPAAVWWSDDTGEPLGGIQRIVKGTVLRGLLMEHTEERNLYTALPMPAVPLKEGGIHRVRLLFANAGTSGTAYVGMIAKLAQSGTPTSSVAVQFEVVFTESDAMVEVVRTLVIPGVVEASAWNVAMLSLNVNREASEYTEDTLETGIYLVGAEVFFQQSSLGDGWD